jgi:peptide/nickel transport system substrate-binding protein
MSRHRPSWRAVGGAALAGIALLLASCSSTGSPDEKTTLRVGVQDINPVTYDLIGQSFTLSNSAVYDGLFENQMTEGGELIPQLATGYERSDDWKTVTLTLRDDVTFVDGVKFTADTLKAYLEGMYLVEGWWFKGFWDQNTPTLTVIDPTTLEITSDKPMNLMEFQFLKMLFTGVPIASPHSLDDLAATKTEPLGSGAYLIEEVTEGVSVKLVRNEDHWNRDAYPFDEIEITQFADDVAALNALQAGQIDATKLASNFAGQAESEGFILHQTPGMFVEFYIGDREGALVPALADQRVRQALAMAFDRVAINESMNDGFGIITSQPFVAGSSMYVDGGDDRYPYDPERARELLAEAGYPDGFDIVIPTTPLVGINSWEPIIETYLADIGIQVTFENYQEGADWFAAAGGGTYPVVVYPIFSVHMAPFFLPATAYLNAFKIADVDANWTIMENGPDDAAAEAARELGEYVVDQAIVFPISAPSWVWATAPGVQLDTTNQNPALLDFQRAG